MLRMYLGGYMHKTIISDAKALILVDLCLDSMFLIVPFRIYNFELVYENINTFLSNDHIWN